MPPIHPSPSLSTLLFLRQTIQTSRTQCSHNQVRHATFIPRPRRPYTFTQLVTLSDGSTYLHRTSSPLPVFKSTKDTRNTQLWNPSSQRLMNVESDEAGRLRMFRNRFGRGWDSKKGEEIELDAEGVEVEEVRTEGEGKDGLATQAKQEGSEVEKKDGNVKEAESGEESLLDLISSPEFDSGVVLGPKEKKFKRGKK